MLQQNKLIIRDQEQIKAQNASMLSTLSVVFENTIPRQPELQKETKEHFRIPVKTFDDFDRLELILKDKTCRMKLVNVT